jgi:parvulin-like peptidyl-prolyl isomerase
MRVLLVLVFAIFLGPRLCAEQRVSDGVRAIVNDSIITYQDVARHIQDAIAVLADQYARKPEVLEERIREVHEQGTEDLVDRQLILHEFKTGGYNYPEAIIEDEIERRLKDKWNNRATLLQSLQARGMTQEMWRRQQREEIIVILMQQAKVPRDVLISPQKILNYYETNQTNFAVAEQVKLRTIMLNKPAGDTGAVKQLAQEILRKIDEGASFAEMAKIHSDGPQRATAEWAQRDPLHAERDTLRKELTDVAFSLKAGEKSGVIDLPDACWILFVEEKKPPHVRPLSEVRDDIERFLRLSEVSRVQRKWIKRLKEKAFLVYF